MTVASDLQPLGGEALAVRRIRVGVGAAVALVLSGVATFALSQVASGPWWLLVAVVAVLIPVAWWWAHLEFGRWAWRLDEDVFEVRHGVLVHRTHLVPRNRIQNVTTTAGPIQTRFGVVTLTVQTAGARTRDVSVENIDVGHAQAIRRRLGLA